MFPWFQYIIFMLSTVSTPGPNNIMCMSSGTSVGIKKSLPLMFGIWTGIAIVSILVSLFCNALEQWVYEYKIYILIIGAVYILYLAFKTATSKPIEQDSSYVASGFGRGLVLQFINPKLLMFAILTLETYVLPYYAGQVGVIMLFAMLQSLFGFMFIILYALCGRAFKALFGKYGRVTNIVMALALVYCAVALFL